LSRLRDRSCRYSSGRGRGGETGGGGEKGKQEEERRERRRGNEMRESREIHQMYFHSIFCQPNPQF
jgi:hypothetical protein